MDCLEVDPMRWKTSFPQHLKDLIVPFFVPFLALPPVFVASMSPFKVVLAFGVLLQQSILPSSPLAGPYSFVLYPTYPSSLVLPQIIVWCSSLKCATVISYLIKDNLVFLSNNALSLSPLVALRAGQVMVWYLEDQLGQCFIFIVFSIWSFDISMVLFIHIVDGMSIA